ncbi:MAG: bifunctional folylpolyglutamate synthase/dihydrofolate synthase, partial [Elusimicrobia bacterium]|nr:bifunctional folylpolyglutamate synthase/dihydrofolate synthase [Elusimicrobiota bacterium]
MTYKETLVYLHDSERFGIKPGLERIKKLLDIMGNPQSGLRVIRIAGTNGKGSTAAFISSILKESGYKTGLYISPHLTDFRERITINGSQIPQEDVALFLTEIKNHIAKMSDDSAFGHLTYFEIVTALAFSYFARKNVDFAVLEVGLGGRLDATNVVEPLVAVITNSDYDHMDIIGADISSIAAEDAGIIKKKGLVITAAQGEAVKVIEEVCRQNNAQLFQVVRDIKHEFLKSDWKNQSFDIYPAGNDGAKSIFSEFENLKIPLLGRHQLINACCAIGAIQLLKFHNILISDENIRRGLAKTRWPGRLEIVRRSPLVILDGAHNHPAAKQLKEALLEYFLYRKEKRLILV